MKNTDEVKRELFCRLDEYRAKKKKRSNTAATLGTVLAAAFLLSAVIVAPGLLKSSGGASTGAETNSSINSFIACVTEFGSGRSAVVRCIDRLDSVVDVGTEVSVQLDYDGAEINDMVMVTYTGEIMETFPVKIQVLRTEYLGKSGNLLDRSEVQKLLDEYRDRTVFNPVTIESSRYYSSLTPEMLFGMAGGVTVGGNVQIPELTLTMLEDDADSGDHAGNLYAVLIFTGVCDLWSNPSDSYTIGGKTVGEWKEQYKKSIRYSADGEEITSADQESLSMLRKANRDILESVIPDLPRCYINYSPSGKNVSFNMYARVNNMYARMNNSAFSLLTYDELITFCKTVHNYPVTLILAPSDGIDALGFDSHAGSK